MPLSRIFSNLVQIQINAFVVVNFGDVLQLFFCCSDTIRKATRFQLAFVQCIDKARKQSIGTLFKMPHFCHFSQSVTQRDRLVNFDDGPCPCESLLFIIVLTKVFVFFHTTLAAEGKHEHSLMAKKVREGVATFLEEQLYTALHQKTHIFAILRLIVVADALRKSVNDLRDTLSMHSQMDIHNACARTFCDSCI